MLTLTRGEMKDRLARDFPPAQTESLVEVLDVIREMEIHRAVDTQELKQGLAQLTNQVTKLAAGQERLFAAQQRTDQSIAALTAAQQRTDERMAELAAGQERLFAAQQRTDERLAELAAAQQRTDQSIAALTAAQQRTDQSIAALTAAQQRTDERVAELAAGQDRLAAAQLRTEESLARLVQTFELFRESVEYKIDNLREAVGNLANRFGFDLEEFVAALLPPYLERHFAIAVPELERRYFDLGKGKGEEVDLVGEGRRNGQKVTVLVECHVTVGGSEVRRMVKKLKPIERLLPTPAARVMVAMNVHPTAREAGESTGVLVIPYSRINRERV